MVVIFGTSLPDYAGTTEYLAFFNNGQDTGAYTLGFHAINAATVDAESLSAMNPPLETPDTPVPEPASVVFLVLGGAGALFRRRRRHR